MAANPTVSDLHVNTPLSNISYALIPDPSAYVAWQVFPIIPVTKQGDKYYVYDESDFFRTDAQYRGPGTPVALSGYRLSDDSYFADRIALGHPIPDPERANADPAVSNLDADATEYLMGQIMIKDEVDWVATYFTTSVWDGASSTTDMTGGSTAPSSTAANFLQWNDVASTPIEDIHGEQGAVLQRTGKKPNTLVVGWQVWNVLRDHPDILDRIKYTEKGIVTTDLVASLLDVDKLIVGSGIQNTAAEGSTADSMAFVTGKAALLCYVTPTPGLKVATAGYQFVWTGATGTPANGMGARVKRWRNEEVESDIIEMEKWRDFKVVASSLGAFFTTAVA